MENSDAAITIRTLNCAFRAVQCGAQPSTIFLHGFGGDLHTWDLLWSSLDDALPVLRYDLRGFGESHDCVQKPFSHADDLLAILDTLAIAKINLVGLSMGGAIALNFALDHPARVNKLILISPGLIAWEWSAAWVAQWRAITSLARGGKLDEARELWWQHPLFATTRASRAAADLHASIARYSGQQWIRDLQQTALPDVERVHTLNTPTLLLTGGRDLEDFQLIADVIEASVPKLLRVTFSECGHMLPLENPQACAKQILAFLGSAAPE